MNRVRENNDYLEFLQVHECVLSFYSNFFRFLIRRAKEENPGKLVLEFKNYSKEIISVSVKSILTPTLLVFKF